MSDKVKRAFCEFSSPPGFFDELEAETARHSGAVADAGRSFKANLEAAGDVANVPFLLARQGAAFQMFNSMLTGERILSLKLKTADESLAG